MVAQPDYWRQLGILDPSEYKHQNIQIIGAGSIGSATALCLAKVGLGNLTVWDNDSVEAHNLPNQLYPIDTIGKKKVDALTVTIYHMTGFTIAAKSQMFSSATAPAWPNSIVIAATDSMTSRADIWKSVKLKPNVKLFIDARMGGQVMRIYTVNPMSKRDCDSYERTLYPESKAVKLKCSERSICYNIFGIASLITNQVKKFLKQEVYPNEIVFDYQTVMMYTDNWKENHERNQAEEEQLCIKSAEED